MPDEKKDFRGSFGMMTSRENDLFLEYSQEYFQPKISRKIRMFVLSRKQYSSVIK